jgi:sugar transferase (PEP-CTERM/EpsH1 system associated)
MPEDAMKILFVCHRLPYPPNRGGKIRPFNMIRHLSKKHQVVVASLAHTEEELKAGSALKEHCDKVLAEVVPNSIRWARAGQALVTNCPSSVAYFWSPELRRRIEGAALRFHFDAVMVHCAFAAQYALDIPAKFRLLDFGDLDSGKWFDYRQFRSFPIRYGYGLEARKLRRYEKQLTENFDYCTLTTQGELEEFKQLNVDKPSTVIPNGVDATYFQPHSKPKNSHIIAFVGRMDYFPNIDGATHFARGIFPIIRQRVPKAELWLVGSNPRRAVRDLGVIPGVKVTGHVADIRPYLLAASVTVAPLRLARGTQNKILESMAMGIPVVATAVAAKGVAAVPGKHLFVADDPAQFAGEVSRVLENETVAKSLADSARKQVQEAHSWPRSMQVLDSILDNAPEKRPEEHDLKADSGRVHSVG